MHLIWPLNFSALSTVRSVEPSLTTVMSTSVTAEFLMMCARASNERWIMLAILSSSLSAGIAMRSFISAYLSLRYSDRLQRAGGHISIGVPAIDGEIHYPPRNLRHHDAASVAAFLPFRPLALKREWRRSGGASLSPGSAEEALRRAVFRIPEAHARGGKSLLGRRFDGEFGKSRTPGCGIIRSGPWRQLGHNDVLPHAIQPVRRQKCPLRRRIRNGVTELVLAAGAAQSHSHTAPVHAGRVVARSIYLYGPTCVGCGYEHTRIILR